MSHVKNYKEQGGEKWVVGGELVIRDGGKLLFNNQEFKPATFQTNSTASTIEDLKTDFNLLLEKLKQAGVMDKK